MSMWWARRHRYFRSYSLTTDCKVLSVRVRIHHSGKVPVWLSILLIFYQKIAANRSALHGKRGPWATSLTLTKFLYHFILKHIIMKLFKNIVKFSFIPKFDNTLNNINCFVIISLLKRVSTFNNFESLHIKMHYTKFMKFGPLVLKSVQRNRQMDIRWSVKLSLTFGSGELKKIETHLFIKCNFVENQNSWHGRTIGLEAYFWKQIRGKRGMPASTKIRY